MDQKEQKSEYFILVTVGQCEHCGYDYTSDKLKIPAGEWMAKCPNCGRYSQSYQADYSHMPKDNYDLEKENNKKCPVCGKIIDYHIDGFIHYENENVWIHAGHTVEETEKALNRKLTEHEKAWITY